MNLFMNGYQPTLEDLQTAYSELTEGWMKLSEAINELSTLANRSVWDLAYVDNVYHKGSEENKMYYRICEIAEYLETFSRYF